MQFHIKAPEFSVKERNTFGFLIARYLWSHAISDIMQNKKVISCFIDVKKSPPKNGRGYLSIAPLISGEHSLLFSGKRYYHQMGYC